MSVFFETCLEKKEIKMRLSSRVLVFVKGRTGFRKVDKPRREVIGVNNRDLHTFQLDPRRTERLAGWLEQEAVAFGPDAKGVHLLALSGIATPEDVERGRACRCSGLLVGEALMRSADVPVAIARMMAGAGGAAAPLVKVYGVRRVEDVRPRLIVGGEMDFKDT